MSTALQSSSHEICTHAPLPDEVQTRPQAAAKFRRQVVTPVARHTPHRRSGLKIVLTLTLAMLGGVGISQGLLHGFVTESVWLVAWGFALLASAAGVKRTIVSDADGRTIDAPKKVRAFVGSQPPPARTSPFSV